jgi:carboxyl-terminal processing protease
LHTKSATALVQYLDKNNLMQEFISVSQKHIPFSQDEYEISKTYIKQHVYAYIIRNILGDEGFYPFYQKYDTTIITAHEALK